MSRDCPYCMAHAPVHILTNHLVVPTKGAFHSGFDIVACGGCGGVYADQIPETKVLNDYYAAQSKKAQGYKIRNWKETDIWAELHRATKAWITQNAKFKNSILDVGCFTGHLMSLFKDERPVFGYDPSDVGREIARNTYGMETEVASRFRDTSYFREGMKFGLVIMSHVAEHIPDIDTFFADIRPALEDDGQLYIEVPDITNWFISPDAKVGYDHREPMLQLTGEHINFFSPASLTRMMQRLGYDCVKCESRVGHYALISSLWRLRRPSNDARYISKYYADSMTAIEAMNVIMNPIQGPVYVWGAGGHTQRMLQYSEMRNLLISEFIDSNVDYLGGTLAGRSILRPSEISQGYPIIISSLLYQTEILEQIKDMGLKNQIITFY